eukprot:8466137-Ditylum_brightwellii.AAC.1
MLGKEAAMILKQLSRKLAVKWDYPKYQVTNNVKTMISLSIVTTTNHCLQGSWVPSDSMRTRRFPCKEILPMESTFLTTIEY